MNLGQFCKAAPIALAIAVGAMALPAPAVAQEDGVTVLSPYTVKRERSRGALHGEDITVSRVVSTRDLDLRYAAHVSELNQRIDYAARDVCAQIDTLTRVSFSSETRQCYLDAVRDARRQANRLVRQANYYR